MSASCVHGLFEQQASAAGTSKATAVEFRGRAYSYREINQRANQLAHALIGLGVEPDSLVGLRLPRGPDMIIGMLAILKAGAAYLPLDPTDTSQRSRLIIESSNMRVLLVEERSKAEELVPRVQIVALRAQGQFGRFPIENPCRNVHSSNLAYVMYTSGSTGMPKGVAMPHSALVNLLSWHRVARPECWGLRTLQFCSPEFDFSFHEIFSTLCAGGALVMAAEEVRYDPQQLALTIRNSEIQKAFLPVSVLLQWAEAIDSSTMPLCLRCVITTGEPLRITQALRSVFQYLGASLHNHYGATEFQDASTYTLSGDTAAWPSSPPAGFPVANMEVHVLNDRLQPVRPGEVGQIHIGGAGLARGYIGSPELTAARFVCSNDGKRRLYATGDLGFHREDGALVHLGRRDSQIKLAGRRLDLGEIEHALMGTCGVRQAVVVLREDEKSDARLIAYIVAEQSRTQSDAVFAAQVIADVRARLPAFMVPRDVVVLDRLPLTRNGKVDRAGLPDPQYRPPASNAYIAPRGIAEQRLAVLWSECLKLDRVGVQDNFFERGGDSLAAARVAAAARAVGLSLTAYDIFRKPTIALLVAAMKTAAANAPETPSLHVTRHGRLEPEIEKTYRLTGLQEGLLYHHLEDPTLYVIQRVFNIVGALDVRCLQIAWDLVMRRHEALRAAIRWQDVLKPVQRVHRRVQLPWHYEDWRALPPSAQAAKRAAYLQSERQRGICIDQAPMLRIAILRCADEAYSMIVNLHHIIMDGWSWELVLAEIMECYRAAILSGTPDLSPAPSYEAYVNWATSQDDGSAQSFWSRTLSGAGKLGYLPGLDVATEDKALPKRRGQQAIALSDASSASLSGAARRMQVTINTLCQGVWAQVLNRWTGERDVVFGTVTSGRSAPIPGVESTVGLLANTIPVRVKVHPGRCIAEWLRELQSQQAEARAYEFVPLAAIHRWNGLSPSDALFHSLTVHESYLNDASVTAAVAGLSIEAGESVEYSNYALSISTAFQDVLRVQCTYDTAILSEATVAGLLADYRLILEDMVNSA